jgi:hypothetical protein
MNLLIRRSLIFIVLLFGGLVLYSLWYGIKADRYEETAVPFLQEAIPVLTSWDYKQLKPLLSPSARRDFENEKMQAAYRNFSRLGRLQSVGKPQYVTDRVESNDNLGDVEVIEYKVPLDFNSGMAMIKITLLANGDVYYVHHFGIHSDVFANE